MIIHLLNWIHVCFCNIPADSDAAPSCRPPFSRSVPEAACCSPGRPPGGSHTAAPDPPWSSDPSPETPSRSPDAADAQTSGHFSFIETSSQSLIQSFFFYFRSAAAETMKEAFMPAEKLFSCGVSDSRNSKQRVSGSRCFWVWGLNCCLITLSKTWSQRDFIDLKYVRIFRNSAPSAENNFCQNPE